MASKCPSCGATLHIWNVRAECRKCGANIPNYNWEQRLEEDNIKAEAAFEVFHRNTSRFVYCTVGTKLRIVRLVFSFLPIIGFIVPWATLKTPNIDRGWSLLTLILHFFKDLFADFGIYFTNMKFEQYGGPVSFGMISLLFYILHILFIVVAFFLILLTFKKPKTKVMVVFDALSIVCSVVSVIFYSQFISLGKSAVAFNFGNTPLIDISGGISWGFFVALALLITAFVINLLVSNASVKSDEELEEERLAKVAAKEAKEEEERKQKEIARAEAAKAAEEENKKKIEAAKARVAELETKDKK